VELSKRRFQPDHVLAKIKTARQSALPKTPAADDEFDLETLLRGKMELQGLMPWSSNYTFLVALQGKNHNELLGIYKPGDGERPLWDFPSRTLSQREFASFLVSQVLGWPSIPLTVMRDGPHGLGSVQLFIEAEYEAHYFNLRDIPNLAEDFRRMALFDYIVNNADRKGGHCLKGKDGRIWAIDHGLTFHVEPKLRTVIWEFCDEPIPDLLFQSLNHLEKLMHGSEFCQALDDLISSKEIKAFRQRIAQLVSTRQFPKSRAGRNVPYPPI
jgi:hypothetical protein